VLLGAAGISCGGDSGGDLPPEPQIVTDRDSIVDQSIFAGQQKNQTLQITNKGQQDLVVSGFALQADTGWTLSNTSPNLFPARGRAERHREVQQDGLHQHGLQADQCR
jgi:hypothetical protein